MNADPVGMARGHTPHRDGGYSSEANGGGPPAHEDRVLLCQPLIPPTFCARLSHLAHPFNADTGLVAARVLGTRSRSASSGRDPRPQLPRHRDHRVPSKWRRPRGRGPNRGARVHPHHPGVIGRFAVKMTRDWDERPPAARRCVFTAHGPRDVLRQGGSSGCPGLWPGGDLALNMAFHNDVAGACPHRRTTTRCRTTHFHRAGWTVTRRP